MNKRFLPVVYKRDLYLRVSFLNQGQISRKEYIRKFEQLKIRSGLEEESEQAVVRFLKGLDQSIVGKVDLQAYWSFEDVCKLAIKVDKYSKNKKLYKSSYSHLNPLSKPCSTPKPETQTKGDFPRNKEKGVVREFPKQLDEKKCFKCQGYDHFQAECPKRRALPIEEIEEIE